MHGIIIEKANEIRGLSGSDCCEIAGNFSCDIVFGDGYRGVAQNGFLRSSLLKEYYPSGRLLTEVPLFFCAHAGFVHTLVLCTRWRISGFQLYGG